MYSVAVAELILNGLWIAVAIAAFAILLPRSSRHRKAHAIAALLCATALLFPVISLSDDLSADRDTFEVLAAVLVAFALIIGLITIAQVSARALVHPTFVLVKHADPRSPPAR